MKTLMSIYKKIMFPLYAMLFLLGLFIIFIGFFISQGVGGAKKFYIFLLLIIESFINLKEGK